MTLLVIEDNGSISSFRINSGRSTYACHRKKFEYKHAKQRARVLENTKRVMFVRLILADDQREPNFARNFLGVVDHYPCESQSQRGTALRRIWLSNHT